MRLEELLALGILLDLLDERGHLVPLGLGQDVLGQQRLEAARQRVGDLVDRVLADVAKFGVCLGKCEHHEHLVELVDLEAVVARLGAFAHLDALVRLRGYLRVVHLVAALIDAGDAHHRELGVVRGRDAAVEGKIRQLRLLHCEQRGCGARAGGATLGVAREDDLELIVRLGQQHEDLLLPRREVEDVRQVHLRPHGEEALVGGRGGGREARSGGLEHLGDHRVGVARLQVVVVHARHLLAEGHLVIGHVLVLDHAAERERAAPLLESHKAVAVVLARDEGWT